MYNLGWWDMFTNYGFVEFYLLYKLTEKTQEADNAGIEDGRTDSVIGKFE